MSALYDDGRERLTPQLGLISLIGCFLSTPSSAQASTSHKVKVDRGIVILDDHVHQQDEEDDRVVSTDALADGYSRWTAVAAYYNPATNGTYLINVDGADVLTSAVDSDDQPTEAEIEAAIEALLPADAEYYYAILGDIRVGRATTTYTLHEIDLTRRPFGVRADKKSTTQSGSTPA